MTFFHSIRRSAGLLLPVVGALLAGAGHVQAQSWQLALSSVTQPGTSGICQALATATDADGNAFVVGSFSGTVRFGATQLVSVNQFSDMFVAKWSVATQNWAWAASGGGSYFDGANGVAVRGHEVFVTGQFISNDKTPITAVIAGVSLPGAGDQDVFVARYLDQGTTYANGWAVSSGGKGSDNASGGLARQDDNLYVSGVYDRNGNARFAGTTLPVPSPNYGAPDYGAYLAKYPVAGPGPPGAGWAVDVGTAVSPIPREIAVSGSNVFVVGSLLPFNRPVTIAGTVFPMLANNQTTFLAKYVDNGASAQSGWGLLDTGYANALAVRGNVLYTAGGFRETDTSIAGTALTSVGGYDVFLARYLDQGTSGIGAGAIRDGGPGTDFIYGLALGSNSVFVTGGFDGGATSMAGTSLTAPGATAAFVAKYADSGTGFGPGWALASSGAGGYGGRAVALSGQRVFVAGSAGAAISFGTQTLTAANSTDQLAYLAVAYDGPAPLPVTLTAFTATAAGPLAARLAWATASETNSARFEVERGVDGVGFAKIGAVAAAGNSSSPRQYDFRDAALPAGANGLYYRLRLVDQDGTATYSPVRAVRLGAAPAGLLIFPNPTSGPATLAGAAPGGPVQVLDALGRVVLTATADAGGVALLPAPGRPGVYVVRVGGRASRWVVE